MAATPTKKKPDADHPLHGTVAFIDVHCEGAESKAVIQSKIQELGGRVVGSFSKTVTHVVFKDGKKSTLTKAVNRPEVKLVSVMWVEECSKQRARADETPFLVDPETTPPASKRSKSMKPQAIGSSHQGTPKSGSTQKAKKPAAAEAKVLCEETQALDDSMQDEVAATPTGSVCGTPAKRAKTNLPTAGSSASNSSSMVVPESPMASGVPATPPQAQAATASNEKGRGGAEESSPALAKQQQQQGEDAGAAAVEKAEGAGSGKGKAPVKRKLLSRRRNKEDEKKEEDKKAQSNKRKENEEEEEDKGEDKKDEQEDKKGEDGDKDEGDKEQEGRDTSAADKQANAVAAKPKLKDVTNNKGSGSAKVKAAEKTDDADGGATPAGPETKRTKTADTGSGSEGHSDAHENGEGTDHDQKVARPAQDAKKQRNKKTGSKKKNGSKAKDGATSAPRKKRKILGHIVVSGLNEEDLDVADVAVEELGGFDIHPEMTGEITHVVSSGKRTLKVLEGITRGCWVVSTEWIKASMEAGHWLDEAQYELSDTFPGVTISRQRRQSRTSSGNSPAIKSDDDGKDSARPLFPKNVTVYIGAQTRPHRHFLQQLVTRSGGQLSRSAPAANIVIGLPGCKDGPDSVRGKEVVSEKWLLDCITQQQPVPTDEYSVDVDKLVEEERHRRKEAAAQQSRKGNGGDDNDDDDDDGNEEEDGDDGDGDAEDEEFTLQEDAEPSDGDEDGEENKPKSKKKAQQKKKKAAPKSPDKQQKQQQQQQQQPAPIAAA